MLPLAANLPFLLRTLGSDVWWARGCDVSDDLEAPGVSFARHSKVSRAGGTPRTTGRNPDLDAVVLALLYVAPCDTYSYRLCS